MLTRYDSAPINELTVDPNTGFLHATNVPIARTGVFPYMRADGSIVMEAKLPSELLTDTTVTSANNKPITDNHPPESVNSANTQEYMRGFTASNAHVDGDRLKVDMTITDKSLIDEIQDGKQELSIGFRTELSPIKGEFNGMKYDSVQKNIQINHVAVVKRGRAGHTVRLTGDSAEMIQDTGDFTDMETRVVRADGQDITVSAQDVDKVTKLDADNSEKAKRIEELEAELAKLKGSSDADKKAAEKATAKADALEKELADAKSKYEGDALDKAIAERMDAIEDIKPYVGDSYDFKGKSIRDMKVDAIKRVDSVDYSDKEDTAIDAYFDAMKKRSSSSVVGLTDSDVKADSADEAPVLDRYNLADNI